VDPKGCTKTDTQNKSLVSGVLREWVYKRNKAKNGKEWYSGKLFKVFCGKNLHGY